MTYARSATDVSKVSEKLKNGETIAQLHLEFEAALPGQQVEPKGKRRVMQYQSDDHLDPKKREELDDVLSEFSVVFWQSGDRLPSIKGKVQHCISLKPGSRPGEVRPRGLSPSERGEVKKEIS